MSQTVSIPKYKFSKKFTQRRIKKPKIKSIEIEGLQGKKYKIMHGLVELGKMGCPTCQSKCMKKS